MSEEWFITYVTSQPGLLRAAVAPRECHTDDNDAHQQHHHGSPHRDHNVQVHPARDPGEELVHSGYPTTHWRCYSTQTTHQTGLPLRWLPFPRRKHMTMIATMMTRIADTTGTTRLRLASTTRTGESVSNPPPPMSGSSRAGAIVPETPTPAPRYQSGQRQGESGTSVPPPPAITSTYCQCFSVLNKREQTTFFLQTKQFWIKNPEIIKKINHTRNKAPKYKMSLLIKHLMI